MRQADTLAPPLPGHYVAYPIKSTRDPTSTIVGIEPSRKESTQTWTPVFVVGIFIYAIYLLVMNTPQLRYSRMYSKITKPGSLRRPPEDLIESPSKRRQVSDIGSATDTRSIANLQITALSTTNPSRSFSTNATTVVASFSEDMVACPELKVENGDIGGGSGSTTEAEDEEMVDTSSLGEEEEAGLIEPLLSLSKEAIARPPSFAEQFTSSMNLENDDDAEYPIDESVEALLPVISLDYSREFKAFPYYVQWEMTRVALHVVGPSVDVVERDLPQLAQRSLSGNMLLAAKNRGQFWEGVKVFAEEAARGLSGKARLPPPMTEEVWTELKSTEGWPNCIELKGELHYSGAPLGKDMFRLELSPLTKLRGKSDRFACRFGSDRFMRLSTPSADQVLKSLERAAKKDKTISSDDLNLDLVREKMVEWFDERRLRLMNREWSCFYHQNTRKKSGDKNRTVMSVWFAESGVGLTPGGILDPKELEELGFVENWQLLRKEMTRGSLVDWAMPLRGMLKEIYEIQDPEVKGSLSATKKAFTFKPSQIEWNFPDTISPEPDSEEVMNDGCSVCSPEAMQQIREQLGLRETPTAVQGRLGGSKGIWFVDPTADRSSKDIWIRVTKSQLKYPPHKEDLAEETCDWARLTLFVVQCSKKPQIGKLNLQLTSILYQRGVPFEVFRDILTDTLKAELSRLDEAAHDRAELRRYISRDGGLNSEPTARMDNLTNTALPLSDKAKMCLLLDAGFTPQDNEFLLEKLNKIVEDQCKRVYTKLHLKIFRSTTVYCIADPTGTLNEGEISLQFSQGFLDEETKVRQECLEGEVLIARNPAFLPSDIQKVRAIVTAHPGLRQLKDVAVFPTKGSYPLADLLSGGDYDGDKIWITWEKRIVEPFVNCDETYRNWDDSRFFGKRKLVRNPRPREFFRRSFEIALQETYTGRCNTAFEAYAYKRKSLTVDEMFLNLAKFCGKFVDAQKHGIVPKDSVLRIIDDPIIRKVWPLYKAPDRIKGTPEGDEEDWFFLDRLVFGVAKRQAQEIQARFENLHEQYSKRGFCDRDLIRLYHDQRKRVDPPVMVRLESELNKVRNLWKHSPWDKVGFDNIVAKVTEAYDAIQPSAFLNKPVHEIDPWWEASSVESTAFWKLLKASTAVQVSSGRAEKWCFYCCSHELCHLKAMRTATQAGGWRVVTQDIWRVMKPERNRETGSGLFEGDSEEEEDGKDVDFEAHDD